MRTYVFDTCDQDPICGVSPFVGADVFPMPQGGKSVSRKSKKPLVAHFQVLCASSLYALKMD